jgi:hypothetical protein
MWNIVIPILCVLSHIFLLVVFLPGFWREIDTTGFRWHHGFSLFVVPLLVVALIGGHVLGNRASLPDWLLVTTLLTVDALVVAMVVAAIGLRRRRGEKV